MLCALVLYFGPFGANSVGCHHDPKSLFTRTLLSLRAFEKYAL